MSPLQEQLAKIYLVRGILNIPLSFLTAIPNAVVLYLFWKDPKHTIRGSPTNVLVASLAMVDFLVGAFLQPISAFWFLEVALRNNPPFQSRHLQTMEAFLLLLSMSNLLAISVDRYIAVTSAMRYHIRMTKRRVHAGIACIWLYCIGLISGLQFLEQKHARNVIFCIHIDIILIMTIVLFWLVVHYLRVQAATLQKMDSSNQVTANAMKRQRKVTKTVSIVLGIFLLCSLPWATMMQIFPVCKRCKRNMVIMLWLFKMFFVLFQANCTLNPFLGAFRLPKFRRALNALRPAANRQQSNHSKSSVTPNPSRVRLNTY